MRTWMTLALIVGLATLLSACRRQGATPAFNREYRMQVTVGPTTHWGMGAAKFAELAAEKTGGRIVVKPYYGSQLLKGAQLSSAQMVAMKSVDLAFESTINTAPVIPEMNIFSLPFFLETYPNTDRLEQGKTGELLFAAMKRKGLMPLAWGENGFRQLTNSRRPVTTPEDLKGLRVRVVGSPLFRDIFRALGADPINMNWGDAVTAFQQRTVDGQENPAAILVAVQIHQYHKYMTLWNYLIDPLILYWNLEQFEAFPPDIQAGLREAATEAARYQKALARAGLDDGTALRTLEERFGFTPDITSPNAHLESAGMEIVTLTEEQRELFRKTTREVFDDWAARLGPEVLDAAWTDLEGSRKPGP